MDFKRIIDEKKCENIKSYMDLLIKLFSKKVVNIEFVKKEVIEEMIKKLNDFIKDFDKEIEKSLIR